MLNSCKSTDTLLPQVLGKSVVVALRVVFLESLEARFDCAPTKHTLNHVHVVVPNAPLSLTVCARLTSERPQVEALLTPRVATI